MPRCKNCKQLFEVKQFNRKYCYKDACNDLQYQHLIDKAINKAKAEKTEYYKDKKSSKGYLQDEINKLSKMIDKKLGYINCIDCDKPLGFIHAAHLHNVKGNENIRYNLHNLHSARAHCNQFSSEHKVGYRKGLIERYEIEYKEWVEFEMPKIYDYIGLKENEVKDALKIVRKIIREFNEYNFSCGIQARTMFNELIGIYTERNFK